MADEHTKVATSTVALQVKYLVVDASPDRQKEFGEALIRGKEGVTYLGENALPHDLGQAKYLGIEFICHSGMVETVTAYLERRGDVVEVRQDPAPRPAPKPHSRPKPKAKKPKPKAKVSRKEKKQTVRACPPTVPTPTPVVEPVTYGFRVGSLSWHMERQRKAEKELYLKKLSAP